jgi:hypothetical protein
MYKGQGVLVSSIIHEIAIRRSFLEPCTPAPATSARFATLVIPAILATPATRPLSAKPAVSLLATNSYIS